MWNNMVCSWNSGILVYNSQNMFIFTAFVINVDLFNSWEFISFEVFIAVIVQILALWLEVLNTEDGNSMFLQNVIPTYNTTRCHSPEDYSLNQDRCMNASCELMRVFYFDYIIVFISQKVWDSEWLYVLYLICIPFKSAC
jgi:hypothetical protein